MKDLGYTLPLFILPFDHRNTFEKAGFKDIQAQKLIIYEAFKKSLGTVPKESAAILVDEQYGDAILKEAKQEGTNVLLTTEKSGQEDFVFEYGEEFATHIEKYSPTFVKALVRVQDSLSEITKTNLKKLSDYIHNKNFKFLLEIVAGGELDLILKTISDLQNSNIEPDVWKIEGMQNESSYEKIVAQARQGEGRANVSVVILGRGENRALVQKWLKTGSKVKGVIGFAVGRTVFWDSLIGLRDDKISREDAILEISENFKYFYNVFIEK